MEDRSGCFKIQRLETGNATEGKRPNTTNIRFAPRSSIEVLVLIGELHEAISLRLKLWVINIEAREVAAESGEVTHEFKYGGGLLPLDVHTIAAINGQSDNPAHPELWSWSQIRAGSPNPGIACGCEYSMEE